MKRRAVVRAEVQIGKMRMKVVDVLLQENMAFV